MYGHDVLASSDVKILLDVMADHLYSETIEFNHLPTQKNPGRWTWTDERVCFHALLMPQLLVSGSLQMVPEDAMPKMLGPSYQIDLCAAPGVEYGKTRLEVNPDSSENFIMLKH